LHGEVMPSECPYLKVLHCVDGLQAVGAIRLLDAADDKGQGVATQRICRESSRVPHQDLQRPDLATMDTAR
jgi:hypothetical protein